MGIYSIPNTSVETVEEALVVGAIPLAHGLCQLNGAGGLLVAERGGDFILAVTIWSPVCRSYEWYALALQIKRLRLVPGGMASSFSPSRSGNADLRPGRLRMEMGVGRLYVGSSLSKSSCCASYDARTDRRLAAVSPASPPVHLLNAVVYAAGYRDREFSAASFRPRLALVTGALMSWPSRHGKRRWVLHDCPRKSAGTAHLAEPEQLEHMWNLSPVASSHCRSADVYALDLELLSTPNSASSKSW